MKQRTFITIFFIGFCLSVAAQTQQFGSLAGQVYKVDGILRIQASNANVKVLTANHDTLKVAVPGGIFYFGKLPIGKTTIITSMTGMATDRRTVNITTGKKSIVEIKLSEEPVQLKEVVVKGRVPIVVHRKDTLILNASAVNTLEGDEAMKILEQMPGVDISDNEVKVMNSRVTKTYVDGKLIFGYDPLMALKNLPANDVTRIKVFDEYENKQSKKAIMRGQKVRVLNIETKSKLINSASGHFLMSGGANLNKNDENIGNNLRNGIGATGNFFSEKFILTGNVFHNNIGRRSNRINDILNAGNSGNSYQENTFANINTEYNKNLNSGATQRFYLSYTFERVKNLSMSNTIQQYFPSDLYEQRSYSDSTRNEMTEHTHQAHVSFNLNNANWGGISIEQKLKVYDNLQQKKQGIENIENNLLTTKSLLHNRTKSKDYNWNGNIDYTNGTDIFSYTMKGDYAINSSDRNENRADTLETSLSQYLLTIPSDESSININGDLSLKWAPFKNNTDKLQFGLSYKVEYSKDRTNQIAWNVLDPLHPEIDVTNTYSYRSITLKQSPELAINALLTKKISVSLKMAAIVTRMNRDEAETDNYEKTFCTPYIYMRLNNQSFINNWDVNYSVINSLPSIPQLRPQIDNSNPYLLRSGNPNLQPTINHVMSAQYSKLFPKTGDMLIGGATLQINTHSIVGRTTYFQTDTPLPELNYTAPAHSSLISYENINGYINATLLCNWRHSIPSIKSKYSISANFAYLKNPYYINTERVTTNSYTPSLLNSLAIIPNKKIKLTLRATTKYTFADNTNLQSNRIFAQNAGMDIRINQIFKIFYWNTTYNFQFLRNFESNSEINRNHSLNINLGCKLFKRKADISLCAYDLLNSYKNIRTMMMSNYIETTRTNYFGRYFTINFAWRFSKIKSERGDLSDGGPTGDITIGEY